MIEKNSFPNCIRLFSSFLSALTILAISTLTSAAGISTDGTMGPATTLSPGGTSCKDYTIPQSLGQQKGANLFHSFRDFNVDTGYNATFTGPAGTANVIGRVTGGNASWIDGKLGCDIAGADLWLLNPFGILFGSKASLDVKGSFHASTADYLQLSDGGVFYSDPSQTCKLTVAAPSAFGFLSNQPQNIDISGSHLSVQSGKTLSLIGGEIQIANGKLVAPSGKFNLVSVASPGLVKLKENGISVEGFSELGNIHISSSAKGFFSTKCLIDVSGLEEGFSPNGSMDIYCNSLSLDNSIINADSYSNQNNSGDIRIYTSKSFTLADSYVWSSAYADGKGGNINIESESLILKDAGRIITDSNTTSDSGNIIIRANDVSIDKFDSCIISQLASKSTGNGGYIDIETESLNITNGGAISSRPFGAGTSGDIKIKAVNVMIDGADSGHQSSIFSTVMLDAKGSSGDINIETESMKLTNGGQITNGTAGEGSSGNININTSEIIIDGAYTKGDGLDNSGILSVAHRSGDSGCINLETSSLDITHGGFIASRSYGEGGSRGINIKASEINIDGAFGEEGKRSTITAQAYSSGEIDPINIEADSLKITNGGRLSSDTFKEANGGHINILTTELIIDGVFVTGSNHYNSDISSQADVEATGNAGSISIDTQSLKITNGAIISASTWGKGNSGSIYIHADDVIIDNGYNNGTDSHISGITSKPEQGATGDAGIISIDTCSLKLTNGGGITADNSGDGKGGDIDIKAKGIMIDGGFLVEDEFHASGIASQAGTEGNGNAGSINISAESLKLTHGGAISAATRGAGDGGNINVRATDMIIENAFSNGDYIKPSFISADSIGSGNGGNINIESVSLKLTDGGQISSNNTHDGNGGNINILAADMVISGASDNGSRTFYSGIFCDAWVDATGNAGSINVEAESLAINRGGKITASTYGDGNGGNIQIASKDIIIDGVFVDETDTPYSGIYTMAILESTGDAGSINLNTDTLKITNGGRIDSRAGRKGNGGNISIEAGEITISGVCSDGYGFSSITCAAFEGATGNGGSIDIGVSKLTMTSGAVIASSNRGTGDAGDITLSITDKLECRNSLISTDSALADGGDITIRNTGFIVWLIDSAVTATVGGGSQTTGGNIRIDSPYVVLKDSKAIANAYEGKGGSIHIDADTYLADWTSTVSASSTKGISGKVDINSPLVDISALLSPLPTAFVDVTELLANDCETRYKHGKTSSLVVRGRRALPAQPGNLWPSPVMTR